MLDPAIIHDFQRAVVPPAATAPAIVRDRMSPAAETAARLGDRMIADGEAQTRAWQAKISQLEAYFPTTRDIAWSEDDLRELDTIIRVGERQLRDHVRQARRIRRRGEAANIRLTRRAPSLAAVQERQWGRIDALNDSNIALLRRLITKFREHRALVDTRSGAEPGSLERSRKPNAATVAAMKRARIGKLETVTLEDLRASILADD